MQESYLRYVHVALFITPLVSAIPRIGVARPPRELGVLACVHFTEL